MAISNNQISVDYQYNVYDNSMLIGHYPTSGVSRNVTILDYDSIGNFSLFNLRRIFSSRNFLET